MAPTTTLESNCAVRSAWNGIRTLSYPEGAVRVRVFEKGRLARYDMMGSPRMCYSFAPTEGVAMGDIYVRSRFRQDSFGGRGNECEEFSEVEALHARIWNDKAEKQE